MLLQRALFAALIIAPFVCGPSEAAAQTGLDHAAVATANAEDVGAAQNSQAPQDLPTGIAQRFADQTLPPGLRSTRGDAVAPPADDTGTDTGTEDPVCLVWETVFSGFSFTQVCVVWGTP